MHKKLVVLGLVLILGFINWSILSKENHLSNGDIAILKLAPVDPRSLMQGDYMTLTFSLANQIYNKLPKTEEYQGWRRSADANDGFVKVILDNNKLASFDSLHENFNQSDINPETLFMRFRVRQGRVIFATNAFFFQEGHAKFYETAQYGQFRVDAKGELLLEAMLDSKFEKIIPPDGLDPQ